MLVLGEAHGPADDGAFRGEDHRERLLDGGAVEAGGGEGLVPVGRAGGLDELLVAVGVLGDEAGVDRSVGLDDHFVEEAEERLVAADADLEEEVGEGGALEHAAGRLGVLEPFEAGFGQRVHRDDLRPGGLGLFEGREHPGVVGAGVLPGDDDQVGLVEVLEADAALADPDGLGEGRAGRLVAHVGAVGQVVGAELAGEELEEERRLVAGAARGVEERLVGGGEGGELLGDDLEGAFPGHGLVPVGALGQVHGLGDASLLSEPVTAAGAEVGDGVGGEEVGGDAAQGRLLGDGLGAVLAELGRVAFVALGPGAAGAVEAVLLVDLEEGLRGAADAHLLLGDAQGVGDGGQSGGGVLDRVDLRRVLDRVSGRGLGCHGAPLRALAGARSRPRAPCHVFYAFTAFDPVMHACRVTPRGKGVAVREGVRGGGARVAAGPECQWSVAGSGAWLRRHRRRRQTTDRACS